MSNLKSTDYVQSLVDMTQRQHNTRSKENFSVGSNGNLVLRDILVDMRDIFPRRNFIQRKVATQIIVE